MRSPDPQSLARFQREAQTASAAEASQHLHDNAPGLVNSPLSGEPFWTFERLRRLLAIYVGKPTTIPFVTQHIFQCHDRSQALPKQHRLDLRKLANAGLQ